MTNKTFRNYLKKDGITYKTINTKNAKGIFVSVDTRKAMNALKENAPRIRKFVKNVANSVATR